ncbi:nuclear transport factor 2 family protein [Nonomuraea sp. NPDC050556]|uniref:nuclear transport factor 2 family protein n=1 Tax=Nonomuraea sp. NPDC050556 TaxID=3364369 RepID=UPI0037958640
MSEHPHIAVAGACYDALAKGDLDHLRDQVFADDVVFHVPGRGALAGEYRGKDAVLGYLGRLAGVTGGTLRYEPEAFMVGDGYVAALLRIRGERDGRALDDRGAQVFRIVDGRISERWSYPQDPYTADTFFA